MVLDFRELPTGTIPFKEGTKQILSIPRVNAIRWLELFCYVTTVADNTATPTKIENAILKIIKEIRLTLDGDDHPFTVDAKQFFYLEAMEKGTDPPTNKDDIQTKDTTKTWYVQLRHDFATNRLDETDISGLFPSKRYSMCDLEITWGKLRDMFLNVKGIKIDVANSGCRVERREVFETDQS